MRRYAVPLVIVASTALLAGLVVLWKSISAESAPEVAAPGARPAPTPAPEAVTPAPTGTTARSPFPSPIRPRAPESPTGTSSGPTPSLEAAAPAPGTKLNTKNLEWGLTQMRAQVAATEAKVLECLSQASDKPTGDVTLTFIAAKRGDKIVIEDTAVDHDATTIKGDALLECLHPTSKAMTFEGLPREAEAVFITRTIKVDAGGLVENKLIKFSYIR